MVTSETGSWAGVGAGDAGAYRVSVAEHRRFREQGFLVVPGLVSAPEVAEPREHTEELMQGRLPEQRGREMGMRDPRADRGGSVQGLEAPPAHPSPAEKAEYFLRIHMLHGRWHCTSGICSTRGCSTCRGR